MGGVLTKQTKLFIFPLLLACSSFSFIAYKVIRKLNSDAPCTALLQPL